MQNVTDLRISFDLLQHSPWVGKCGFSHLLVYYPHGFAHHHRPYGRSLVLLRALGCEPTNETFTIRGCGITDDGRSQAFFYPALHPKWTTVFEANRNGNLDPVIGITEAAVYVNLLSAPPIADVMVALLSQYPDVVTVITFLKDEPGPGTWDEV
jgi:hypothetical protein